MPRCPTCSADVDLATDPSAPFCSERCRLVDLGRWLTESYSVPAPRTNDDDPDDEAPVSDVDPDAAE